MKHLVFLLTLITLLQCSKEQSEPNPRDASRIEGKWRGLFPSHPDWEYQFSNGLLTQSHTQYGAVLSTQIYPYAIRTDTIFVGGAGANGERWLTAYFHCDSLVELHNVTPGNVLSQIIWLKKTF